MINIINTYIIKLKLFTFFFINYKNMTQHYLDSLHDDITSINLSCNNLTILHDLSRFKYLKKIYYTNNQLTSLPKLNKNL